MTTALLVIIYVAFISLGLPDSLLGSGWPVMRLDFGVSTDMGGIVSFVVSAGTVISSIMSARLIEKFGAGKITGSKRCLYCRRTSGLLFFRSILAADRRSCSHGSGSRSSRRCP